MNSVSLALYIHSLEAALLLASLASGVRMVRAGTVEVLGLGWSTNEFELRQRLGILDQKDERVRPGAHGNDIRSLFPRGGACHRPR